MVQLLISHWCKQKQKIIEPDSVNRVYQTPADRLFVCGLWVHLWLGQLAGRLSEVTSLLTQHLLQLCMELLLLHLQTKQRTQGEMICSLKLDVMTPTEQHKINQPMAEKTLFKWFDQLLFGFIAFSELNFVNERCHIQSIKLLLLLLLLLSFNDVFPTVMQATCADAITCLLFIS